MEARSPRLDVQAIEDDVASAHPPATRAWQRFVHAIGIVLENVGLLKERAG